MLRRSFKQELLNDVTPQHLVRLDVSDMQSRVHLRAVDIGIGAEAAIKIFWKYIMCDQTAPGVPVVRPVYSALHWIEGKRRERKLFT